MLVVRDKTKLDLLKRPSKTMAYLFSMSVYDVGQITLEVSRSGANALVSWSTLTYFGTQGFQSLLAHMLSMQVELRKLINEHKNWIVVNPDNFGLVTLFRMYPVGVNAAEEFAKEDKSGTEDSLLNLNAYQFNVYKYLYFKRMREAAPALGYTSNFRTNDQKAPLSCLKTYPTSVFLEKQHLHRVIAELEQAEKNLTTM